VAGVVNDEVDVWSDCFSELGDAVGVALVESVCGDPVGIGAGMVEDVCSDDFCVWEDLCPCVEFGAVVAAQVESKF